MGKPDTGFREAHRLRAQWMEDVLACSWLNHGEKLLAIRIALHFNIATHQCNPSLGTLAKGVALSERQTKRIRKSLEELHLISHAANPGGGRNSNNYVLLANPNLRAEGPAGVSPVTPLPGGNPP